MIMPNMAMIAVITTDRLRRARSVPGPHGGGEQELNKVQVDLDTSTNDTSVSLPWPGAAAPDGPATPGTPAFDAFQRSRSACTSARWPPTARATALITVTVRGAVTPTTPMRLPVRWRIATREDRRLRARCQLGLVAAVSDGPVLVSTRRTTGIYWACLCAVPAWWSMDARRGPAPKLKNPK